MLAATIETNIFDQGSLPVVGIVGDATPAAVSRTLFSSGVRAVLHQRNLDTQLGVWAILAAASGHSLLPEDHATALAVRLEEPRLNLGEADLVLLRQITTMSVESAGLALGYSPRHAHRNFGPWRLGSVSLLEPRRS